MPQDLRAIKPLCFEDKLHGDLVTKCSLSVSLPISGSVIAIYGAEKNYGKFTVEDFCMADLPPQSPRPTLNSDRYTHTHTHF